MPRDISHIFVLQRFNSISKKFRVENIHVHLYNKKETMTRLKWAMHTTHAAHNLPQVAPSFSWAVKNAVQRKRGLRNDLFINLICGLPPEMAYVRALNSSHIGLHLVRQFLGVAKRCLSCCSTGPVDLEWGWAGMVAKNSKLVPLASSSWFLCSSPCNLPKLKYPTCYVTVLLSKLCFDRKDQSWKVRLLYYT